MKEASSACARASACVVGPRPTAFAARARALYALTKPRVVSLIVFTALIGMLLGTNGAVALPTLLAATLGIALIAGAAAAANCLLERRLDAVMQRTRARPLPRGAVGARETALFAATLAVAGTLLLFGFVNALTAWLTLATFAGYAFVYTLLLKPFTPQGVVIGGAAGAMPPVLGWAAVTGHVTLEPLLLFLIIFVWTPPHFWALALYRVDDYARAGFPALPVTHGRAYTQLQIVLYVVLLLGVSLLPYGARMSGLTYLVAAAALGLAFVVRALRLYRSYSDAYARATFRFSIAYLAALFAALLVDHWL